MSRRRSRKQHSRRFDTQSDYAYRAFEPAGRAWQKDDEPLPDPSWAPPSVFDEQLPVQTKTACGQCREFVEGSDFGRGTCLHPASGVLSPWPDTPGCDYYRSRR